MDDHQSELPARRTPLAQRTPVEPTDPIEVESPEVVDRVAALLGKWADEDDTV